MTSSPLNLSPGSVHQIARRDGADRLMAERGAMVREEMRTADNPEKIWPVRDLVDALGLLVVTRKRLLDHFAAQRTHQISLRELMDGAVERLPRVPAVPPRGSEGASMLRRLK